MSTPRVFTAAELATPNGRVAALLEVTPEALDAMASDWGIAPAAVAGRLADGPELTTDEVFGAADALDVDSTYLFGIEGASLAVALRIGLEHFRGAIRVC